MVSDGQPQLVFIDTSALRGMKFRRDVGRLLAECKVNRIKILLSETTIWERGRQQYESDVEADRIVPYPKDLGRYLAWYKALFESHGVVIIQTGNEQLTRAAEHIADEKSYFNKDSSNDQRDALVLATAESSLDKSALILCHDKNLKQAFREMGFENICPNIDEFIQTLVSANPAVPQLNVPDLGAFNDDDVSATFSQPFQYFILEADPRSHDYLVTLPQAADKLNTVLADMQEVDAEMRRRILGYTQWFSPVRKQDLYAMLEKFGYQAHQLDNNAQRLKLEGILLETEHQWLTNVSSEDALEICEQAKAIVMPEILKILEV